VFWLISDAFGAVVGLAIVFLPPVRRFTLAYQHGSTRCWGVLMDVVGWFEWLKSTKQLNLFGNPPYT
jgi:hypothetical protein